VRGCHICIQAFAAGSFLYLAVHEIMDSQCCSHVGAPTQVGLLMTGVVFMALIALGE
jgi:zinc transporter ZupT